MKTPVKLKETTKLSINCVYPLNNFFAYNKSGSSLSEVISKMCIRLEGKARGGEKAEHTRSM
jgi:hypothetical protein